MSSLLSPIELSDTEKLEILQRFDRYRKWESLDDQRYCLVCGDLIDGHGILVVGGTRGTGPLRLICSTDRCHSIPMDWVIPTDEVLARIIVAGQESAPEEKILVRSRQRFSERLRKFALQFRPAA
jgi:hypothetical protein